MDRRGRMTSLRLGCGLASRNFCVSTARTFMMCFCFLLFASPTTCFLSPVSFPSPILSGTSCRSASTGPSRSLGMVPPPVPGRRGLGFSKQGLHSIAPGPGSGSESTVPAQRKGAQSTPQEGDNLQLCPVEEAEDVLVSLLNRQWDQAADALHLSDTAATEFNGAPDGDMSKSGGKAAGVRHVVGGFSVVVRMPERGVAYRMQPMSSLKAGLTWLAFYHMLHNSTMEGGAGLAEAFAQSVLFQPDRSIIQGKGVVTRSWEDLAITQLFQGERLRKATRRLGRERYRLLQELPDHIRHAKLEPFPLPVGAAGSGGKMPEPALSNGLMFPTHWFWLKVGRPAEEDGELHTHISHDHHSEAADDSHDHHHEMNPIPLPLRRMKGSELASILLLRSRAKGTGNTAGPVKSSKAPFDPHNDPVPRAVGMDPQMILVSVFPHAQGDVGGLNKRLWGTGAPDNVSSVVIQDVLRGLRRLHSIGVPHGDVKAANVLYTDGQFYLTDLPALNWSATPVLTKDPVAHTLLRGKRLLCNDLWGLGIVALSLVCGYKEMELIKAALRKLDPLAYSKERGLSRKMDGVTQNWLITVLLLLSKLEGQGTPATLEAGQAARDALNSAWLKRVVPAIMNKNYVQECAMVASKLQRLVATESRSRAVVDAIVYCLDVTDVSRNALGMPWLANDS